MIRTGPSDPGFREILPGERAEHEDSGASLNVPGKINICLSSLALAPLWKKSLSGFSRSGKLFHSSWPKRSSREKPKIKERLPALFLLTFERALTVRGSRHAFGGRSIIATKQVASPSIIHALASCPRYSTGISPVKYPGDEIAASYSSKRPALFLSRASPMILQNNRFARFTREALLARGAR